MRHYNALVLSCVRALVPAVDGALRPSIAASRSPAFGFRFAFGSNAPARHGISAFDLLVHSNRYRKIDSDLLIRVLSRVPLASSVE